MFLLNIAIDYYWNTFVGYYSEGGGRGERVVPVTSTKGCVVTTNLGL